MRPPASTRGKFSGRAVGGPLNGRTVRAPIPMKAVVRRGIGATVIVDGVYVWSAEDRCWQYRHVPAEMSVFASTPQFVDDITNRVAGFLSIDPGLLRERRGKP